MTAVNWNKPGIWDILLLVIRIWLGYRLIGGSYSSVIDILTSEKERAFFTKWFGNELHFPFPVVMAFIAKGVESFGGILIILGLFTRPASLLVAFTMLVATLTANLGEFLLSTVVLQFPIPFSL